MVDNPSVPTVPPDPPKASGPIDGPSDWTAVEETKKKRREFGAGIAFPTGDKIRHFVLEIRFKQKLDNTAADGSTLNLHGIHREFVSKLMASTEGDAHLMPTAKEKKRITTTPCPIVNVDSFPSSDRDHRKFFHRTIYYSEWNKRTVVKIHYSVLMKETVFAVKQKMFDWLSRKNLWMLAGELNAVETSGIGWMLGAHPYLAFTPDIAERLNFLISQIPQATIEAKVQLHGTPDDLDILPTLFVNPRDQPFGAPPGRVVTKAVTVSCVINRTCMMKELISSIPPADLPYPFIPMGLATMKGPEMYKKFICINNDRQNEVQGINVRGCCDALFSRYTDATQTQTVMDYFMGQPSIASVERTHQRQENGRYIIIVFKEGFAEASAFLHDFCSNKFKMIYGTQEQRDNYHMENKSHPYVVALASPGGATADHSDYLAEMLAKEETAKGKKYATSSTGTWASKVAPRFTFDQNSEHPNAALAKMSGTAMVQTTHLQDNNSISSGNSGSTLAPTTQIHSTGQTVVSQDLSSVVSQMQTMASEQTRMFERMIEKQDKLSKRQAKENRKAAEATQRANDNMMAMVIKLIRDLRGGRPTKKKKKTMPKVISTTDFPSTKKRYNQRGKDHKGPNRLDIHQSQKRTDNMNMEKNADDKADIDLGSQDDELGSAGYKQDEGWHYALDEDDVEDEDVEMDNDTSDGESNDEDGDDDDDDDSQSSEDSTDDSSNNSTRTPPAENKEITQRIQDNREKTTKSVTLRQGYTNDRMNIDYQESSTNIFSNHSGKTSKKSRMTTEEARRHTKDSIEARKKAINERTAKKMALKRQTVAAMVSDDVSTSPSTPKRKQTRQRSPGGTPDNEQKLQRTGTAPERPTTDDELARALNFEAEEEKNLIGDETKDNHGNAMQQK
jgi:hypothetical protein